MGIEKIDSNFKLARESVADGKRLYTLPHEGFTAHGVYYDEKTSAFVRMDSEIAYRASEGCGMLSRHTAGGRLRFATDSALFELSVAYDELWIMSHMPLTGSGGFSLFEETENGENFIANLAPLSTDKNGFTASAVLPSGKMREYVLYFPLYGQAKNLTIALDESAKVQKGEPYRDILPILYYGSSITQGGCASRPDNAYEALICKRNHIDFINLGFSGNAKAENAMVEYLSSIDCSLFVCDYDHNAPTAAYLQETHYRLYEQYRKARPDTPILFISKPDIAGDAEGEQREKIIRRTYLKAKRQGDQNVYFLSGKSFYGKNNRWNFAVEGCHPTDYGFALMAEKIYKKMQTIDEKFGREKDD